MKLIKDFLQRRRNALKVIKEVEAGLWERYSTIGSNAMQLHKEDWRLHIANKTAFLYNSKYNTESMLGDFWGRFVYAVLCKKPVKPSAPVY
jgi:hypothetical protein